jgi:hypothetical protein
MDKTQKLYVKIDFLGINILFPSESSYKSFEDKIKMEFEKYIFFVDKKTNIKNRPIVKKNLVNYLSSMPSIKIYIGDIKKFKEEFEPLYKIKYEYL